MIAASTHTSTKEAQAGTGCEKAAEDRSEGLAESVRWLWRCTGGGDPSDALRCASEHPARMLSLDRKGSLRAGADADLVLLDAELNVQACFVGGRLAFAHPELRGSLWFYD